MASSMVQAGLADLQHELASTRRLLERIPEGQLDYTPHPKSWPLGKLAAHLVNVPMWGIITMQTETLAFDAPMAPTTEPTTTAEFLALWDRQVAELTQLLDAADDATMQVVWTGTAGGKPVLQMPRIAVFRGMILNHMIHHRAQLTMYYRMLDVPVPPLYGPTADER